MLFILLFGVKDGWGEIRRLGKSLRRHIRFGWCPGTGEKQGIPVTEATGTNKGNGVRPRKDHQETHQKKEQRPVQLRK